MVGRWPGFSYTEVRERCKVVSAARITIVRVIVFNEEGRVQRRNVFSSLDEDDLNLNTGQIDMEMHLYII